MEIKVKLLGDNGAFIEINIVARENPYSDDYWDGNWLKANIEISVAGFSADYSSNLRVDELQSFYDSLTNMVDLHTYKAELITMEQGLNLFCNANSRGQVVCCGKAKHKRNQLDFEFDTDIPTIQAWLNGIAVVLRQYPLIGKQDVGEK